MFVQPSQIITTAWVNVDLCVLGCRERMDCAAIERAYRRYLQAGECQIWPPIVGHWGDGVEEGREGVPGERRFVVMDGRHELLALMALGREKVFVAWLEGV